MIYDKRAIEDLINFFYNSTDEELDKEIKKREYESSKVKFPYSRQDVLDDQNVCLNAIGVLKLLLNFKKDIIDEERFRAESNLPMCFKFPQKT